MGRAVVRRRLYRALRVAGKTVTGSRWQIVPSVLSKFLADPDPAKAQRVMQAMLQMIKLDIDGLRRAYDGA